MAPDIEVSRVNLTVAVPIGCQARAHLADCVAPHDVVGRVDYAIFIEIARSAEKRQHPLRQNGVHRGRGVQVVPKHILRRRWVRFDSCCTRVARLQTRRGGLGHVRQAERLRIGERLIEKRGDVEAGRTSARENWRFQIVEHRGQRGIELLRP